MINSIILVTIIVVVLFAGCIVLDDVLTHRNLQKKLKKEKEVSE